MITPIKKILFTDRIVIEEKFSSKWNDKNILLPRQNTAKKQNQNILKQNIDKIQYRNKTKTTTNFRGKLIIKWKKIS